MEADRRSFLCLLGFAVGVLVILLTLTYQPSLKMTVSCSHKGELSTLFSERDILPTNVKPLHYDLTIIPEVMETNDKNKTTFNFDGKVSIRKVEASHSFEPEKDVLTFKLEEPLPTEQEVSLDIEYSGIINDQMAGFYCSSYKDKITGEKKFMGATQFESTDARQAFPCWDEPAVKATFSINLIIPKELTGLSNMDIIDKQELPNERVQVKFRKSPLMSTYLVAWVIGDLEFIETVNKHGVTVRVFSTKGTIEQGHFALNVASQTLDYFTEYFGIEYPLPKMDMVAIPDFSAGAMENWGLVTYRTAYLLFDEANSSLKSKQNVAYVVGHELAHQWFGNLVTMEWWSDLWLNEGFATWVGWLAADHLFPEWDIWTEFVVDDCQAGLRLDGLRSSHPIEVPVKNPAEISQIFDSISYSKGASVIRMLVTYLGEESFQKGLREYLKKHKYKNARTEDLWSALSEASGKSVDKIMHHWTRSIGYPVVDVSASVEADRLSLDMTQSRFLNSGSPSAEEDQTLWSIPLRLGTNREPLMALGEDAELLTKKKAALSIAKDVSYFKLNMGQAGFYRVNYPSSWLDSLGRAVKANKLMAADRIGLVSDAFAMTVAGKVPLTAVLNLLKYFDGETDYLVWGEIGSQLSQMLSIWWEQPAEDIANLKNFIVTLVSPQVETLGFDFGEKESDKVKLLRPLVIGLAGKCGHSGVIEESRRRFTEFIAGNTSRIHPNLRGVIYSIVLREGGLSEYEKVYNLYETLTVVDQKLAALGALGSTRDEKCIERTLALCENAEAVRPQDVIYITRTTGANPLARRATWAYLQKNWDLFQNRYGNDGGISLLGRVVSTSTQEFSSEDDAKKVEAFFVNKKTKTFDRTLKQSLERIRMNAKWLNENYTAVSRWLLENVRRVL